MQRQILKQMQRKLQDSITRVQDELASQVVEGVAGAGAVKIRVNGQREVVSVHLDKSVVDAEAVELLEDLVLTATREALNKAEALAGEKMQALTGGLQIPGMPNIF